MRRINKAGNGICSTKEHSSWLSQDVGAPRFKFMAVRPIRGVTFRNLLFALVLLAGTMTLQLSSALAQSYYSNPEKGLAPRCKYLTGEHDDPLREFPKYPNGGDCCSNAPASYDDLLTPCLEDPYRVIGLSSVLSAFTRQAEGDEEILLYPWSTPLVGSCAGEELFSVNNIGIPMQRKRIGGAAGKLTARAAKWLRGVQETFRKALHNGVKVMLHFNYNPGDISKDFILGCEPYGEGVRACNSIPTDLDHFPYGVVGHVETIREFLFNRDCPFLEWDPDALNLDWPPQCLSSVPDENRKPIVVPKLDLRPLVHSLGNSFIGGAGAEWHSSCWPLDWEKGEYSDENRKVLLDTLMDMVLGRKVLLRSPMPKNDYFDGAPDDSTPDYTFFGVADAPDAAPIEQDCDLFATPASQESLADWTPPQGSTPAQIDTDYARTYLGYFNAAFMMGSNEAATIPGDPYANGSSCADSEHARMDLSSAAESKYNDYLRYYNADAPWAGQDTEVGIFKSYHFGLGCTSQAYQIAVSDDTWKDALWTIGGDNLDYPASPESINCSELAQYGDQTFRLTGTSDAYYDFLYDGSLAQWRQDYTDNYTCQEATKYYGDSSGDQAEWQATVYSFYTGDENDDSTPSAEGSRGGLCRISGLAEGQCDDGLVCTVFPLVSDSDNICIDRFQCMPGEVGIHDWMRYRTVSTLKGKTADNYHTQWVLSYLDQQDWWSDVYERLGYVLDFNFVSLQEGDSGMVMTFEVVNFGYAAPLYDRPVYVVLRPVSDGQAPEPIQYTHLTSWDPREFQPGCAAGAWTEGTQGETAGCDEDYDFTAQTTVFELNEVPPQDYELGIWMPDPDLALRDLDNASDYAVRLYDQEGAVQDWSETPECENDLECPKGVTWLGSIASFSGEPEETPTPAPEETPTPEYCSNGCIWADQCIPVGGKDTPPNCSTNDGFPPRKICTSCSCEAAGEAGFCEELGGL